MRLAALLLSLALWPSLALSQSASPSMDVRRITVLGRAEVEAVPDYAAVTVGVSTRGRTPVAALDANSAVVRRLLAFSTRFGVEARDVRTTSVQVRDVRQSGVSQERQAPEAERYEASNSVRVAIRNIARLGEYVKDVVETGANRIDSVTFGLSNVEQVTDDARAIAVEDATRKARRIAEAAGVKLGSVQEINHPPTRNVSMYGQADLPRRRGLTMDVPIEAGTLDISAEVDVTWRLE